MKALFWSRFPFAREETLAALAGVEGIDLEMVESVEDCVRAVPSADLLVLGDAPVDQARAVLDAVRAPESRLSTLHFISAGREGFTDAGIPPELIVTGPTGANAPTVAEHAIALLLATGRQLPAAVRDNAHQLWDRAPGYRTRSLEGQRILIVGLGNIGREVAARLRGFGTHTTGLRRVAAPDPIVDAVDTLDHLDEHLPEADVVILTLALTADTARILDERRLGLCRPDALLVNVGRGRLVDHDALARALHGGGLWGAALDVTDPEPLPAGHPLWDAPNVVITSHFAGGGSAASLWRIARSAADRARALIEEGALSATEGTKSP